MIEAVTVCVNYTDYLAETLPLLKARVDRVVVVTSADDLATLRILDQLQVRGVVTDAFKQCKGQECGFNRGAAINAGLRALARTDWVLNIDADIGLLDALPGNLDEATLWTVRRRRVIGRSSWERLQARMEPTLRDHPFTVNMFRERVVIPSGYFQMWHWPTRPEWYPESSDNAGGSDVTFSNKWMTPCRGFLTGVTGWHLEMPDTPYRANWKGRTSPAFA